MSNPLTDLLAEKDVLLGDGGMGTSLFELGLANGLPGELWNLEHPDRVESVYKGFVDAGSDIILTNTFGANAYRFALHSAPENVQPVNEAAAELARKAADSVDRPVIVAGSMGPSGEMLVPIGERTIEEVEVAFTEQAKALKAGGADILWIETIFFEDELEAAVRAANNADMPYVSTMTFDTGGRTMMGLKPKDAIELVSSRNWHPVAFGANCGIGPAQLIDTILGLESNNREHHVLVAKGNCGLPGFDDNMRIVYDGTPEIMAAYAIMARDAGARIIGGCCGTAPEHLKAMRVALDSTPRRAQAPTHADIEEKLGPVKVTTDVPKSPGLPA
jgi:5-methyltetrahydrofolate--homocysteine methyltransferase